MKFHHIGVVCKDIKKEINNIKRIHKIISESKILYDEKQDASLCLIELSAGLFIELISGKQVESIIKKGLNYYHICYSVKDIEKSLKEFQQNGSIIVSMPKPAILFNNKLVAFLYVSYGLIEILEE